MFTRKQGCRRGPRRSVRRGLRGDRGGVETDADAASTASSADHALPSSPWYWTMVVSPSDPNVLVLGTSNGLYPLERRRQVVEADGPKGIHATSLVQAGDSIVVGGFAGSRRARTRSSGRAPTGPRQTARGARGEHRRRQDLEGAAPSRPAERRRAGARGRPGGHQTSTPCSTTASSTARPTAPARSSLSPRSSGSRRGRSRSRRTGASSAATWTAART